jgi:hypothetical protein
MHLIGIAVQFIVLIVLQKFVFGNLTLWGIAQLNVAVLFPLFLPSQIQKALGLALTFGFALVLDIFMLTVGIHTFAMVAVYYIRDYWFRIITPMARLESEDNISIEAESQSISWLVSYIFPLTLFYQLVYFAMADFSLSGFMLLKAIASAVYSGVFCFLISILFYRKKTARA